MAKKWLILILIIAAFFRFFRLTSAPPGLNWDEVSIGYNAYSILKTGRDEWGQFLPLSFKAFGEQKLPGMIYASIPGLALFGTTDLGVRVTPAVIGLLGVIALYALAKKLLGVRPALVAAFLLAVSPWAVHFSRVSFEAGLAMVLTITSVYFLSETKEKPQNLWLAMLFAVLAAYTYNSVRILLPLLFLSYLSLGIIKRDLKTLRRLLPALLVGVVLLIPLAVNFLKPEGRVRWGTVNITSQKGFTDAVAESRGYTTLPSILPRLIQNKVTHYLYAVGANYIRLFSSEFLYLTGSGNTQRSVQGMGLFYLFELPLLIVGLIALTRDKKYFSALRVIVPWLLLAPIPSALTIDSPSSVRALGMLPPLLLIEAVGAVIALAWAREKRLILAAALAFVFWNIAYFAYLLWFVYPVKYSDSWFYGSRQVFSYVREHESEFDKIYITSTYGEPYIYTLFYLGYDPHKFQTEQVYRSVDPTGWVHVESFDKYDFTDYSELRKPKEIIARNPGNLLMIGSFTQLSDLPKLFEIKAPNWRAMFEVAEVKR